MIRTFHTTLRCGACVAKIRPALDSEPGLRRWSVDLESPNRLLTVEGDAVDPGRIRAIVAEAGFEASETASTPAITEQPVSYFPLALIVAYILGVVLLVEYAAGTFDAMRAMNNFMAGLFLVFSFFKLLDVRTFADTFAMYDLVARRSRAYALAYPFIELGLGIAYLVQFAPTLTNAVTLVVMLVGTAGIVESLLNRRRVRCACLGSVFNLPMSYVTLLEDVSMAVMAAAMLVMMHV